MAHPVSQCEVWSQCIHLSSLCLGECLEPLHRTGWPGGFLEASFLWLDMREKHLFPFSKETGSDTDNCLWKPSSPISTSYGEWSQHLARLISRALCLSSLGGLETPLKTYRLLPFTVPSPKPLVLCQKIWDNQKNLMEQPVAQVVTVSAVAFPVTRSSLRSKTTWLLLSFTSVLNSCWRCSVLTSRWRKWENKKEVATFPP
jgi:hypothetical protein